MDSLVDDLLARLDEFAPAGEPTILVGESFGGALALSFALAHPARVSGLVIVNSFPYFSPQFRLRLAILRRLAAAVGRDAHRPPGDSVANALAAHASRGLAALPDADAADDAVRLRQPAAHPDGLRRASSTRRDSAPTLFLAASDDHLVPAVEQARLMARDVPGATTRVLDGHGHICLIAPDLNLLEIVEAWQNGLEAKSCAQPA